MDTHVAFKSHLMFTCMFQSDSSLAHYNNSLEFVTFINVLNTFTPSSSQQLDIHAKYLICVDSSLCYQ